MPYVTAEVAAAAARSTVRAITLAELRFASRTMYLHNGFGMLDLYGQEWEGTGGLCAIRGLAQQRTAESAKVTLTLSGIDADVQRLARNNVADVQGRQAFLWTQLIDERHGAIGQRIALVWGVMQRINLRVQPASDTGGTVRSAELEIENPFAARSRPAARYFTDADHQSEHDGDRFCRFVPFQRDQVVIWPDY